MIQTNINTVSTYEANITAWRQTMEDRLRAEDGWLTLAGLHWLHDGRNTVGSDPTTDVPLPVNSTPEQVGILNFDNGKVTFTVTCDEEVLMDGAPAKTAILRDDTADEGATLVTINAVTFFVIKRVDQYGIRVRDKNSAVRQAFTGRVWYDIDPAYHVSAAFVPYTAPRTIEVINSVGILTPMENPGMVTFNLQGTEIRLEAFTESKDELWFIFKDRTNGKETYGAGRFLKAPLKDGVVDLDFNKTYSPPCAFTAYATCPLPPRENILALAIPAGEKYKG